MALKSSLEHQRTSRSDVPRQHRLMREENANIKSSGIHSMKDLYTEERIINIPLNLSFLYQYYFSRRKEGNTFLFL